MKFNIFTIVVICLFFPVLVMGQIVIIPQFQGIHLTTIDQLLQVSLINSTQTPVTGILRISVEDRNQKKVMELSTEAQSLQGGNSISSQELQWRSTPVFGNSLLAEALYETGTFARGEYTICYHFIENVSGKLYGVHCQEQTLSSMQSPPELLIPAHQAEIHSILPMLIWKPMYPVGHAATYRIRLVKTEDGQSPQQAIVMNMPYLDMNVGKTHQIQYPVSAPPLAAGEKYAWQVAAYYKEKEIASTAIWTFTIADEEKKEKHKSSAEAYRFVRPYVSTSRLYVMNDTIYFAFDNNRGEEKLNYEITTENGSIYENRDLPEVPLQQGINYLKLSVDALPFIEREKNYLLTVKARMHSEYFLPFYCQNKEDNQK